MIAKEIEKQGIPVALITALTMVAKQVGANRVVTGTKIPHPCGDPNQTEESDKALRREIVRTALAALGTQVSGATIFVPCVTFTSG